MRAACTRRGAGRAGAVASTYQIRWIELIRSQASYVPGTALWSAGVSAFTLILFDRSDRVYLWMGALFLLMLSMPASKSSRLTQVLSVSTPICD